MATKYGQAAIDYWAKQQAKRKALLVALFVGVVGGATYWAYIAYEEPSDLIGIGIFWAFILFSAWRLRGESVHDKVKRKSRTLNK